MNKMCARCEKIVYSTEELKCLNKVWHKGCFKCSACGMTLSMKTYKGFDKLPYCEAHIPKPKATTVAETPEMKRLAENTKIQSNVQYHAEFEKNKAKFTQVDDDPEMLRLKENSKIISNVAYHGDVEKKALMEERRIIHLSKQEPKVDVKPKNEEQHQQASKQPVPVNPQSQPMNRQSELSLQQTAVHQQQQQQQPYRGVPVHSSKQVPPPQRSPFYQQQQRVVPPSSQPYYSTNMSTQGYHHHPQQNTYQDSNHNSPYSARNSQTLIYSSQPGGAVVQQQVGNKHVGSIADYDPMNDQYGSIASQKRSQQQPSGGYRQEASYQVPRSNLFPDNQGMQKPNHPPVQQKVSAPPTHLGRCFRAMYDYEAADTDEVSFRDGDLLVNCTSIDEGWMTGTVQRTGRAGMLPANYVERVT